MQRFHVSIHSCIPQIFTECPFCASFQSPGVLAPRVGGECKQSWGGRNLKSLWPLCHGEGLAVVWDHPPGWLNYRKKASSKQGNQKASKNGRVNTEITDCICSTQEGFVAHQNIRFYGLVLLFWFVYFVGKLHIELQNLGPSEDLNLV